MELRILGPLEVLDDDGRPIPVAGPPARLLLRLLAAEGEPVPIDDLADALWWPGPWPERAGDQLQSHLEALRRALDRAGGHLVATADGYTVPADASERDDEVLAVLVAEATAALGRGEPAVARDRAGLAVDLARGPALAEVARLPWAAGFAQRLDHLAAEATRLRRVALVALGRAAEVGPELEAVLAADPTCQAAWIALAAVHALGGDRIAALAVVRRARLQLTRSGGRSGPELLALEAAVLADDRDRIGRLALDPARALPHLQPAPPVATDEWHPAPPRPAGAAIPAGPFDTVEPGHVAPEDRIGRRVGLLPQEAQRLVALAAVAGDQVDVPLLARAAGLAPAAVAGHLVAAVAAGVLSGDEPEGTVAFAWPGVAEAVVAGLMPFRRRELHLLLAQASASLTDRPTGERDWHLQAAADVALP